MIRLALLLICLVAPVAAEVLVPARTIRARELIGAEDLAVKKANVAGAFSDPSEVIGQEARVALYPGRPIRPGDVGPPAIIDRNDIVVLRFRQGPLSIETDGRALGRGAVGEILRVMNMSSRKTVSGLVRPDGIIEVN